MNETETRQEWGEAVRKNAGWLIALGEALAGVEAGPGDRGAGPEPPRRPPPRTSAEDAVRWRAGEETETLK